MKTSILGYGMYVPKLRVKADEISAAWGGGSKKIMEKAVTNFDEDVITMAVEAAQSALSHAKVSGKSLGAIYLGTDSSPYIEQGATSLLAEVIDAILPVKSKSFALTSLPFFSISLFLR